MTFGWSHPITKGTRDVLAERNRQQSVEGYDAKGDDRHKQGTLALAGCAYAMKVAGRIGVNLWPFDKPQFKPRSDRENLVRAAALLLAELDRLDRIAPSLPLEEPSQQNVLELKKASE